MLCNGNPDGHLIPFSHIYLMNYFSLAYSGTTIMQGFCDFEVPKEKCRVILKNSREEDRLLCTAVHPITLFSKQHEEMSHNTVPSFSPVPWWSGLGSQLALFSKQHEEMSNNTVSSFSPVPWWSRLGSQLADYEKHFAHQFKTSSKENHAALNQSDRLSQ